MLTNTPRDMPVEAQDEIKITEAMVQATTRRLKTLNLDPEFEEVDWSNVARLVVQAALAVGK